MSDGVLNGLEIGIAPEEITSKGISLYKSNNFKVFVPSKPNITLNEGLHVQVSSGQDRLDSPKQVLSRYLIAEGSAKVLAESGMTQDAWANTRLEQGQAVSTYGRVPQVEDSWRTPVNTFQRGVETTTKLEPYYNTARLQELFSRYLPKWEKLANNIELFQNGVNGKDINEVSREGFTVWENDKFRLEIIANAPHIRGFHLVVYPKESFRRQWQTIRGSDQEQTHIQTTLEATAVAMGVQKLLAEGGGEIHNSGNWALGLKPVEEGGKLDLEELSEDIKAEKKSHRPDIASPENQINTGMHVHVYIPSEGSFVILPPMSKQEAIEKGRGDIVKQWEEIPPTNKAQLEEIRAKLGEGKLTKWLEENCKGQLKSQTT